MKAFFRATTLASLLLAGAPLMAADPTPRRTPQELLRSETHLVIGHRGAPAVAPENTAASFREAIAAGSDLVELDYYVTKDGIHAVFHDKTLDRTTDACKIFGGEKLPVVDRSWEELKRLDAGSWYDAKFKGEPIPRLENALDLIQSGSVTLIERKDGAAKPLVELLREKNLTDDVVVQAFDWEFLKDVAKLEPTIVIGALGSKEIDQAKIDAVAEIPGVDFVGWSFKDLDQKSIDAFHAKNLKVFAYTVNEVDDAKRLLAMGLDGVITDDPRKIGTATGTDLGGESASDASVTNDQ